ncbi:hypothetical protein ACF0H5_000210 [Mactra antiquata]
MPFIHQNKSGGSFVNSKLPPISSVDYVPTLSQTCGLNAVKFSIVPPTSLNMVSQNPRVGGGTGGSGSNSLIYRSIPPKPHTFTLSDMLEPTTSQKGGGVQNKKLGLTGSTSSEFAKRFMTRPTTQPKVVEFSVSKMSAQKRRRGINGFFPPVKLRYSAKQEKTPPVITEPPPGITERNPLQLIPTAYSEVRPKSASRSISRSSRRSQVSQRSVRKTPESVRTAPPSEHIIYPETFEFDDLSLIPPPKKILPRRDLPWVFRYKVKRNMNELSKILASKPGAVVDV